MKTGIKINGKELTATEVISFSKEEITRLKNSDNIDKGLLIKIEEERIVRFEDKARIEKREAFLAKHF